MLCKHNFEISCSDCEKMRSNETELAPLTRLDKRQVPNIHFSEYLCRSISVDLKHLSKPWLLSLLWWITTQNKYLCKQSSVQRTQVHVPGTGRPSLCQVGSPCTCPPAWRAGSGTGRWTNGHTRSSPRPGTSYQQWSGPQSSCLCRTSRGRRASGACWTRGCWWNPGWLSEPQTEPDVARGASSEGLLLDLHMRP